MVYVKKLWLTGKHFLSFLSLIWTTQSFHFWLIASAITFVAMNLRTYRAFMHCPLQWVAEIQFLKKDMGKRIDHGIFVKPVKGLAV